MHKFRKIKAFFLEKKKQIKYSKFKKVYQNKKNHCKIKKKKN